ncbi:NAD(P)/FAD-dependent oxidoreductase [Pseudonocardia xishanensis]|uniref:NAD(P)/FAD-dependent oxidoreductase n=1 Tax=Pseudonocardia xishanensis TaxID=630995 RepID=A0ABP8S0E9_9PSEU
MALTEDTYDVVIVGAGFAGMCALQRVRSQGMTCRVFEAGDDVGGTWYWNRYPGARCDVEGRFYCYSFDDRISHDWTWSERYPAQPEIYDYARYVADEFDLRKDITFGTRVVGARFDEDTDSWTLRTDGGADARARFLLLAVGCLSTSNVPELPGIAGFAGRTFHSGQWPREPVDFAGRSVAVIGTGSSGVQLVPQLAEQAERLYVLQRTPSFSVPARNRKLGDTEQIGTNPTVRAERYQAPQTRTGIVYHGLDPRNVVDVSAGDREEQLRWAWTEGGAGFMQAFGDIGRNEESNGYVADFVRDRIREYVIDPAVAERLCPTDYPIGAKRICVDTGYYETYNRDNVELVDLRAEPIRGFTPDGITVGERTLDVDDVVFATGYDAMTGSLTRMGIEGRDGLRLADAWAAGPATHLGLGVAGFPNMLVIAGPGSPSVLVNMIVAIEQHVAWIGDLLEYMRASGATRFEVTAQAQDSWVRHVNEVAAGSLLTRAASWYVGANIPGKPRIFMPYAGGLPAYTQRIADEVAAGYPGLVFDGVPGAVVATGAERT